MTSNDAKKYLTSKDIPRLFESLMTGLLFNRPEDHIAFLQACLDKVKNDGLHNVKWNAFIEHTNGKKPLPPITPGTNASNGKMEKKEPETPTVPTEMRKTSPLPPIGTTTPTRDTTATSPVTIAPTAETSSDKTCVPTCPVVLLMGGPGSGRDVQASQLVDKYQGWVYISMGDLLRKEISSQASSDTKWGMISTLVKDGEMAPEDVTVELLVENIKKHSDAKGFIIAGYPREMKQLEEYNKCIGKMDLAIIIDCEESKCKEALLKRSGRLDDNEKAIEQRLAFYKKNTLPVVKHFEDQGKLLMVNGDADSNKILFELSMAFDNIVSTSGKDSVQGTTQTISSNSPPPAAPSFNQAASLVASSHVVPSIGKVQLPPVPLVLVMGGPGSGKDTQALRLVDRYQGWVYISMGDLLRKEISSKGSSDMKWGMISTLVQDGEMAPEDVTVELLVDNIKKHSDAKGFIIAGYPREMKQLEDYIRCIEKVDLVFLLDCDESTCKDRLEGRAANTGRIDDNETAVARRLQFYKNNTLHVLKHFEDQGKLLIIDGDRDSEEIFFQLATTFDSIFFSAAPAARVPSPPKSPRKMSGRRSRSRTGSQTPVEPPKTEEQMEQETGAETAQVAEEIIEPAISKENAPVTGGDAGNPAYSQELDQTVTA